MKREIVFKDSAYPEPHQLKEFVWSGRMDLEGRLWFDLHLKSKDYYDSEENTDEEDDYEEEDFDGPYTSELHWKSKIVWDNYHQCILSSTYWSDEQGILLSDGSKKVDLFDKDEFGFQLDVLPLAEDFYESEPSFSIYLLGHDQCANHNITFSKQHDKKYTIHWKGQIALTYGGFEEFDHAFSIVAESISFIGFTYPEDWSRKEAEEKFSKVLTHFDQFEFVAIDSAQIKSKLVYKG
ncbi:MULTISPECIES: hypothetical protein [Myroides]|uniref:Uncharacterized protein n=1 Tax=Myroides albus TaxID=2562892 RepID=A0A6I3LQK4_9FLAO|nr:MULTISPECIES: hypothetical protein [Myroides]MTG98432.1 hypothetical protein [Myroides albus]MVX35048.1 hypothetical protein [Myroides sp. LoEW2-1]UVD79655.1 hypothetical protein NWE55_16290 [Myroides albus]